MLSPEHCHRIRQACKNEKELKMEKKSFYHVDFPALMETARGERFPDLVIMNADLVNVYTREICPGVSISICGNRIAYIGEKNDFTEGPDTRVIDAAGKFATPGFIEGHTHLAWLVPPHTFFPYAARGGTTTIITETMEMYPVGGVAAVEDFLDSLLNQPVKCLATAPAMGAINEEILGMPLKDLSKILQRDDIIGLGESYWQNVFQHPHRFLPGFHQTLKMKKTVEGHSAGASGRKLAAYLCLGISSCHEPITAEQVAERLRSGIHVMVREGDIRSDLEAISNILRMNLNLRYLCLVSDGIDPETLQRNGYLEAIAQKAVDAGFDPLDVIRMVTLNVAEHFHLAGHIGGIGPGRYADILLMEDLRNIAPETVISSGQCIVEKGELRAPSRIHSFSSGSLESVRLPRPMTADDFIVPAPGSGKSPQMVRVIEMVTDLVTKECHMPLPIRNGQLVHAPEKDILKIAAIDRVKNKIHHFTGFITGFGIKEGAFACTGAWDAASIIVIGADPRLMALAVNRIKDLGGGIVVWGKREKLAELALPHYGLFAHEPMERIIEKVNRITAMVHGLGCPFPNPLLSIRTLTGAAIPYLRICEQGLVDLKEGNITPLIIGEMDCGR